MSGTKAGSVKLIRTMIKKYGSREAWCEHMRSLGSKGGRLGRTGGFYQNRELARTAGRIGGMKSRRSWTYEERQAQSIVMGETLKRRYAK